MYNFLSYKLLHVCAPYEHALLGLMIAVTKEGWRRGYCKGLPQPILLGAAANHRTGLFRSGSKGLCSSDVQNVVSTSSYSSASVRAESNRLLKPLVPSVLVSFAIGSILTPTSVAIPLLSYCHQAIAMGLRDMGSNKTTLRSP